MYCPILLHRIHCLPKGDLLWDCRELCNLIAVLLHDCFWSAIPVVEICASITVFMFIANVFSSNFVYVYFNPTFCLQYHQGQLISWYDFVVLLLLYSLKPVTNAYILCQQNCTKNKSFLWILPSVVAAAYSYPSAEHPRMTGTVIKLSSVWFCVWNFGK